MRPRGPNGRDPATLLPTLASGFSFDVRAWKRRGRLFPGNRFEVEWRDNRTLSALLSVFVREDDAVLWFQRLTDGYDRLPLAEEILAIERTHNAGPRTWIVCPGCDKRVFK